MYPTPGNERAKHLENIIKTCLDVSDVTELFEYAFQINGEYGLAFPVERLDRANKKPSGDVASMLKASRHLKQGAKDLQAIGMHGLHAMRGIEVLHIGRQSKPEGESKTHILAKDAEISDLAAHLSAVAEQIEQAAGRIDTNAESPLGGYRTTKLEKTVAKKVALACARVFLQATGSEPARATRDVGNGTETYGPFLRFLEAVFDELNINASADYAAKEALKDFSSRKTGKTP